MKLFLGVLFLYLSGYSVDIGNNSAGFWWFLVGIINLTCAAYNEPKDPPSFT